LKKLVQPPFNPSLVSSTYTPDHIADRLRNRGCNGCDLGSQPNFKGPVVFRGNPESGRMVIGEAPGLKEDELGLPFTGPAGELWDKIVSSVGWDSNKDLYITNVCKCRPVALPGSGKQNNTPLARHRKACMPYLRQEIAIIKPKIIVLLGASAVKAVLPEHQSETMAQLVGRVLYDEKYPGIVFFVMYHPAFLLHSKKAGAEEYQRIRELMWTHIQQLKKIDEEL